MFDLFWLHEENIIIDTLIEMMKNKEKDLLMKQSDELHVYLKYSIVKENLLENNINCVLPKQRKKQIIEKEIAIK